MDFVLHTLPTNERVLGLTFDDGPDSEYTPKVLELLQQYGIHATFFCIGSAVAANSTVARQIVDSGHMIANHTWSHPHPIEMTTDSFCSEVCRTSDIIYRVTGIRPAYFRPPYGELSDDEKDALWRLGYKIVLWSVDSADWSGIPGPQIVANVLPRLHHGAILLHHSAGNVRGMVDALPYIVETCLHLGYRFVRLDEVERGASKE